jgi:hypothetical protein
MSKINYLATIQYWLQKEPKPEFFDDQHIITRTSLSQEMDPRTTYDWDLANLQLYRSTPENGVFTMRRMTDFEEDRNYLQYLQDCTNQGIEPRKQHWLYLSMACNSYRRFRIDIYKPGRIQMYSTLPKYGCASGWLYMAQNKGDFDNPYLPEIDHTVPREFYFEVDLFETFFEHNHQRIACSGHDGTQKDRRMQTAGIIGCFPDYHYCDVYWDGVGNWIWKIDGITVKKAFLIQPENKIFPYLKLTYAAMERLPEGMQETQWEMEWIKFSDCIIPL